MLVCSVSLLRAASVLLPLHLLPVSAAAAHLVSADDAPRHLADPRWAPLPTITYFTITC
jgi:hypothetical protein